MLTMKQEQFVQNLIKGMSQREAYFEAYDAKKMSINAVDKEASVLMKNPKITQRYQELQDALAKASVMTAAERLKYLTGVVKETEKEKMTLVVKGKTVVVEQAAGFNEKLKAIDIMNKMQGDYVTRVEGEVKVKKLEDLI